MIIMSLFLIGILAMSAMLLFTATFGFFLLLDWLIDILGLKGKKDIDNK